ncbi:uncharacterized protein [Apostichopus japonicus]|uniref:uncharacterized protein n=1 Tax=Stichopus japonicus TaxID=307972 RepID=UPI003AB4F7B0
MITIAKIKEMRGKSQPFELPLKCVVPSMLPPTTYNKDGVEKKMQNFVLCDSTGFMKAVTFDVSKTEHVKENATVILKNYITKPDSIIITSKTKIYRAPTMAIDDTVLREAVNYLRPPTPPPSDIPTVKKSPIKSMQSITGKVIRDEAPRQVFARGSNVQVRTVVIEDKTDNIKLSLWKDFATHQLKPGDFVTAENVVTTEYQNERQVSTTSRTKIKISTPPNEDMPLTIIAFDVEDETYQLLCQVDEDINTYEATAEIMNTMLASLGEEYFDETLSMEDRLMQVLPATINIKVCAGKVVAINGNLSTANL